MTKPIWDIQCEAVAAKLDEDITNMLTGTTATEAHQPTSFTMDDLKEVQVMFNEMEEESYKAWAAIFLENNANIEHDVIVLPKALKGRLMVPKKLDGKVIFSPHIHEMFIINLVPLKKELLFINSFPTAKGIIGLGPVA